jgi:hypothetical protein
MLLLCRVIITGTDICTGTSGKDVACAGRNYVAIMSPVLVGLLHLYCGTICLFFSYCGVCKPVE